MGVKWFKIENVKGVRYYEHNTRTYKKRKDRSFALTYKLDGRTKSETLGWESDGWTIEKAVARLQELKQNQKIGEGPKTLAEKREQAEERIKEKAAKAEEQINNSITFAQLYAKYIEVQKAKTEKKSWKTEDGFYRNWFSQKLDAKNINEITIDDIQSIINEALASGRKPATAKYMKAFVRQLFNFAKDRGLYKIDNITCKVTTPSFDNKRKRFYTIEEIKKILSALKLRSVQLHNIAVFAMYTGCRPIEIFSLCWENIDFANKIITVFDTKNNNKTKHVPMTDEVNKMLENLKQKDSSGLVFKSRKGTQIAGVSKIFRDTLEKVGINDGVTDDRQKGVFYTLRHSYASWLMMEGADLYDVKELMGHSTTAMTERYSHLSTDHLKKTAKLLDKYKIY
jgi:integrase